MKGKCREKMILVRTEHFSDKHLESLPYRLFENDGMGITIFYTLHVLVRGKLLARKGVYGDEPAMPETNTG